MLKIAEEVSENRKLEYLNLSWNFLTTKAQVNWEFNDFDMEARKIKNKLQNLGMQ